MKSLLLVVAMASLVAIAGGTARAQVVDPIIADIPFSFTVRQNTMPAGHYTIKRFGSNSEVMELIGDDYRHPIIFLTESAQVSNRPKRAELIFDRVGDQYFLSEVFEEGNSVGVAVPKSRVERRLEKEGAMTHVTISAQNALGEKN